MSNTEGAAALAAVPETTTTAQPTYSPDPPVEAATPTTTLAPTPTTTLAPSPVVAPGPSAEATPITANVEQVADATNPGHTTPVLPGSTEPGNTSEDGVAAIPTLATNDINEARTRYRKLRGLSEAAVLSMNDEAVFNGLRDEDARVNEQRLAGERERKRAFDNRNEPLKTQGHPGTIGDSGYNRLQRSRERRGEDPETGEKLVGTTPAPTTTPAPDGLKDDGLKDDGPTVAEYVKAGYNPANYPPSGYASKSTLEEVADATAAYNQRLAAAVSPATK